VQEEATECFVYMTFGNTCAPENAPKEELKRLDESAKRMNALAFEIGKNIGMTTDAMIARMQMVIPDQMKLTERKCVNFASLFARYGQRCKLVGEHPETVFMEYMNK
jgi:hypothetical protein